MIFFCRGLGAGVAFYRVLGAGVAPVAFAGHSRAAARRRDVAVALIWLSSEAAPSRQNLVHRHTSTKSTLQTITAVVSRRRDMLARDSSLCVKDTCSSTNRVMYTPLLSLWESGRGGRVSSTTRSDAARPRRRGQPTYRIGRQSSALEQEGVIAVLGLPSSRPGGPGLGRWPATTMTGTTLTY